MRSEDTPSIRLADYRPPSHLVDHVTMDVRLHPTETLIETRLDLRPNPDREAAALQLDGEELTLVSIALDGTLLDPQAYGLTGRALTLLQPPQRPFTLTIVTKVNPLANRTLSGLYQSNGVFCTQCEAEGFRRITYYRTGRM